MARTTSGTSVAAFLSSLPAERRREVERVRDVVRKHLPAGYEEVVGKDMLVYQVPIERYSGTYNKQPLWYAAIASKKSTMSLHLLPVYADPVGLKRLQDGFQKAGKKLDMGKACIHFRKADDLAMDAVADVVASVPMDRWVEIAESERRR